MMISENPLSSLFHTDELPVRICHFQISDGMISFLPDTTHTLSGMTVEIPEIPNAEKF
jgi:hypothetical protein